MGNRTPAWATIASILAVFSACDDKKQEPAATSPAGCKTDAECKGDRVCKDGACVDPPATAAKPATATTTDAGKAGTPSVPAKTGVDAACTGMLDTICKTCGDAAPACTDWRALLDDPVRGAAMGAAQCEPIGSAIQKAASVPTARESLCNVSPTRGAVQTPATASPAAATPTAVPCDEMLTTMCSVCGESAAACTGWKDMLATPTVAEAMGDDDCSQTTDALEVVGAKVCETLGNVANNVMTGVRARTAKAPPEPAIAKPDPAKAKPPKKRPPRSPTAKPKPPAAPKPIGDPSGGAFRLRCETTDAAGATVRLPAKDNPPLERTILCRVTMDPAQAKVEAGYFAVFTLGEGIDALEDGLSADAPQMVVSLEPGTHFERCKRFTIRLEVMTADMDTTTVFKKSLAIAQDCGG